MITERDKRQLASIIAIVKPANSLEARLEKLSEEHRVRYDIYCWRMVQWATRINAMCPDDYEGGIDAHLYARSIDSKSYEPRLDARVQMALFGPTPRILKTASEDEAMRIYKEYCDEQR
ncbi:hypothetical protein [Bradyrhizobium sp. RT4b]|uniref:hypothetical protein n=1 Tax=unclassified Bradyrhizobium TaxID=2631580 RepID=UPI003392FF75